MARAVYHLAMTVLLTGSSGWLGRHVAPRLRERGDAVIGLDPAPGEWTTHAGSVADRDLIARLFSEHAITGVIHAGALHKPDIARYPQRDFIDVNVTGTLNLLEEAADRHIPFVFTSTTSLMISQAIRDETSEAAVWLDETHGPLAPRNIYGVTKLAAEGLCRQHHLDRGLNAVVLRTSRFFPEDDDTDRALSGPNMKMNELLNRRASVADMARAHLAALDAAPQIGFGLFVVSAPTPFTRHDRVKLKQNAPMVVRGYFPEVSRLYAQQGWTLPRTLGRVYDGSRITRELGFEYETDFASALDAVMRGQTLPLAHDAAYTSPLARAASHP
ncbi:MAG: NAD(P)-dependent oxidoreductase [Litorimonas sp.]